MKASEFLNKTKAEIQEQLDKLLNSETMQDEEIAPQVMLATALLTNDTVLKQSASTKEGRLQLLTLAEALKGINGVLKMSEEENMTDEEIQREIISKVSSAQLRAQARAIEYDDVEEDVEGPSIYEVRDLCKATIFNLFKNQEDELTADEEYAVSKCVDAMFDEALRETGYEGKTTFSEEEMQEVFNSMTAKLNSVNFADYLPEDYDGKDFN